MPTFSKNFILFRRHRRPLFTSLEFSCGPSGCFNHIVFAALEHESTKYTLLYLTIAEFIALVSLWLETIPQSEHLDSNYDAQSILSPYFCVSGNGSPFPLRHLQKCFFLRVEFPFRKLRESFCKNQGLFQGQFIKFFFFSAPEFFNSFVLNVTGLKRIRFYTSRSNQTKVFVLEWTLYLYPKFCFIQNWRIFLNFCIKYQNFFQITSFPLLL